MASSSSSKKPCYDVFINHRGTDVKLTLASFIYNTLHLMGVQAFLDKEELEVGDSFPESIREAISNASVHIAIFSPSYAESPWCLEELLLMLQTNATIIPVFYRVQPSDLRHVEKGIYGDAFRRHQKQSRHSCEKIKEWEEALGTASDLTGRILDGDNCDEGKVLREIVETALHRMKKVPLQVATFPVGLDETVEDFECKVVSSTGGEDVLIAGIVGIGGSGKTTLAKELYNRKSSSISRSSILFNVRDAASKNTLHELQQKVVEDLRIQHPAFHNKEEGRGMMVRCLRSMTVLIVLDDVDHVEQIDALVPHETMQNLERGSLIIITTREKKVLQSCGIFVYDMKLLGRSNAKLLFCRHAFLQPYSKHGFEQLDGNCHKFHDLIESFVEACNGLPLSLKVVGAMVNGHSKAYWENQLLHLSNILPEEIAKCLKLSYDALEADVRQMFLDVACFFIRGEKSMVVPIWDGSGWRGEIGWETLFNKCLIELDSENRIAMHDHLRDLGRQIARSDSQSSHRIWKEDQISSIQEQISIQGGRTRIRGIAVGLSWGYYNGLRYCDGPSQPPPLEHSMETIINRSSLPELQLLAVKGNDDFRERFAALSRGLVFLQWHDFNGTNLPSWLSLANLRILELCDPINMEELWQDNVEPPLQLIELIIHGIKNNSFRGLPRSIGCLRHLKKIVLHGNGSEMRRLPEEFCHLESLEFLQLWGFPLLSSLPDDFGKLINLQSVELSRVQLTALPASFKQLTALKSLQISGCESFMFTSEMLDVLEFMTELQVLRLANCPKLEELPNLTTQVCLRELSSWYIGLREPPNNICQLTKLEKLQIRSDNLTSLPESLGVLSCLTYLEIGGDNLTSLPESLGALSCLTRLVIRYCKKLEYLPDALRGMSPSACNLKSLKSLKLIYTGVLRISISHDCCPCLKTLQLAVNNNLTEIETLPGNVRQIDVSLCEQLKNMRGIGGLLNLKRLRAHECPNLEVVPCPTYMHSMGHTINITRCPKARVIDDGNDNRC